MVIPLYKNIKALIQLKKRGLKMEAELAKYFNGWKQVIILLVDLFFLTVFNQSFSENVKYFLFFRN